MSKQYVAEVTAVYYTSFEASEDADLVDEAKECATSTLSFSEWDTLLISRIEER